MLKINKVKKSRLFIAGALVVCGVIGGLWSYRILKKTDPAKATLAGFEAGNLMSDTIMSSYNSMTEQQIWDFLHQHGNCNDRNTYKASQYPGLKYHIDDGHFVCMADETFDGETTSHIIWQAAQDYHINPQVLIVVLQKEQNLVLDSWPNDHQYRSATGFGCPDTAACDSQYFGFRNQVRQAANMFREVLNGGWSNYPAYKTSFIHYHPNSGCGGQNIYIANRATSALYRYTPYIPNQAALNAGKGTGDSCSSYGNRNFYNYFTEWFGDTRSFEVKGKIKERYDQISGFLSLPVADQVDTGTVKWQEFQNGFIVGSDKTGYWESKGSIRRRWSQIGYQVGVTGLPIGPEETHGDGFYWQLYEHGIISGSQQYGYWETVTPIYNRWFEVGRWTGILGKALSAPVDTGTVKWQEFQNGFIVGSDKTGYWESKGSIRVYWARNNYQVGRFGLPVGPENYDGNKWWQKYEHGTIYCDKNNHTWST